VLFSQFRCPREGRFRRKVRVGAREHLERHRFHFQPGLNEDLAATAVWGAQMLDPAHARHDGVYAMWYGKAPDYVVNAGGIIDVAAEIAGDYDPDAVLERAEHIGEQLREILREARIRDEAPFRKADAMAREKLEAARASRRRTAVP
jgi:glutamate dehydrogenase/leucine dehydrogenase